MAGSLQCILTVPMELIKIRLQVEKQAKKASEAPIAGSAAAAESASAPRPVVRLGGWYGAGAPFSTMVGEAPAASRALQAVAAAVTHGSAPWKPRTDATTAPRLVRPSGPKVSQVERAKVLAAEIYAQDGVLGFYRGLAATLARDIPFGIMFFTGYSMLKDHLDAWVGRSTPWTGFFSGFTVGSVVAASVTPADVIKTRIQAKGGLEHYGSTLNALRTVWSKEGGVNTLFTGALPRAVVLAPIFGITLLSWELVKYWYAELKIRGAF
jgi:hypothetical protein